MEVDKVEFKLVDGDWNLGIPVRERGRLSFDASLFERVYQDGQLPNFLRDLCQVFDKYCWVETPYSLERELGFLV